jgi:hypothetical protein
MDQEFEYRGANFEAGKYYRIRDEPANFIDWHILHNAKGQPVDSAPSGEEVQDDPRPAAMRQTQDRRTQELARIQRAQAPRATPAKPAPAGTAAVATTTENLYGAHHTPEGSKPAQQPATGTASTGTASTAGGNGSDSVAGDKGSDRPRLPRTA